MTQAQAKLELFKINRTIEKLIVTHANELGRHNKNCLEQHLDKLWREKWILKNIINS